MNQQPSKLDKLRHTAIEAVIDGMDIILYLATKALPWILVGVVIGWWYFR